MLEARVMHPASQASANRIVHFMPTFDPGGAQVRSVQIMNHLGPSCRHAVFSFDGHFGMRDRIAPEIELDCQRAPRGRDSIRTLTDLVALLRRIRPQLVLTYNWGAIEAALAAIIARVPLVHAEDGFGPDESVQQKKRRVLARRYVLRHAAAVVAPSENLRGIMRNLWKLPERVIQYIPNGVDLQYYAPVKRASEFGARELTVATVGQLRREKRQDHLIQACADLHRRIPVRLLIAGEGPERTMLEELARSLGFADQVTFLGQIRDIRPVLQQADIFALSSITEQMPISVLEAMACGLPILSTSVGDIKNMVGIQNQPYVVNGAQEYQQALEKLALDAPLRLALGTANRARCAETFSLDGMLQRYQELYEGCLKTA